MNTKEAAALSRIAIWLEDNPIQIESYLTLSNEDETTAIFLTKESIQSRSLPIIHIYLNIDVTVRYKDSYPKLEYAYVIYRMMQ